MVNRKGEDECAKDKYFHGVKREAQLSHILPIFSLNVLLERKTSVLSENQAFFLLSLDNEVSSRMTGLKVLRTAPTN